MSKKLVCPICNKEVIDNRDSWCEFQSSYHLNCVRKMERENKPFHEKYAHQKRVQLVQVKEVLDLLADKEFLEYWVHVIACENDEQIDELYSHPILKEFDLFP